MSRTRRNEIIVGIFVIVAFGVLFGMTALIRGTTGMNPWELQTTFKNVVGLEIGSPVLVSGFRLGRVTEMYPTRLEDGEPAVIVEMDVARDIPIHKNAVAKLAQQGFVGDMRIEIYPGTEDQPLVEDGEMLDAVPATDITAAFSSAQDIVKDAQDTMRAVKELLTDPERLDRIDRSLENIAQATENINKLVVQNQENLAASIENIQQVSNDSKEIVTQVKELLAEVDQRFASLGDQAEGAIGDVRAEVQTLSKRADELFANADKATVSANELIVDAREEMNKLRERVEETADNLNAILRSAREGDGTLGRLLKDPSLFEEIRDSLAAIRRFVGENRTRPYDLNIEYEQNEGTAAP